MATSTRATRAVKLRDGGLTEGVGSKTITLEEYKRQKGPRMARLKDGRELTYREYIRFPHWAKVRKRYRASRLPQCCVVCGDSKVELHHRSYKRLGHERLSDLVPLCRAHHNAVHTSPKDRNGLWTQTKKSIRNEKRKVRRELSPEQLNPFRAGPIRSGGF